MYTTFYIRNILMIFSISIYSHFDLLKWSYCIAPTGIAPTAFFNFRGGYLGSWCFRKIPNLEGGFLIRFGECSITNTLNLEKLGVKRTFKGHFKGHSCPFCSNAQMPLFSIISPDQEFPWHNRRKTWWTSGSYKKNWLSSYVIVLVRVV